MADDYGTKLITDLPDQFKGKARIDALMMAIGRQFDELKEFYDDLNEKRALSTAEGVQLDMIGSIVGLTRVEAGEMIAVEGISIDDEVYRNLLGYKIMLNTSTATYYDIVHGIRDYYGIFPVSYNEDPSEPARIRMKFVRMDINAEDTTVTNIQKIKPAGVTMTYYSEYYTAVDSSALEEFLLQNINIRAVIPFWECQLLDGSILLDGSALLDAKQSYDARVGFLYDYGDVETQQETGLRNVAVLAKTELEETADTGGGVEVISEIDFLESGCFNSDLTATSVVTNIETAEDLAAGLTTIRNLHYCDGSLTLDGSQLLNSLYEKEDL